MSLSWGALTWLAALALAFANGANDNAKGVATLIGAGRVGRRAALVYATVATLLGSAAALFVGSGLLERFSGKGILAAELTATSAFPLAVAAGAGCTVLLATRWGLPVSTTHALVGSLAGVGIASGTLRTGALAAAFFGPLLLSPLLALGLTAGAYSVLRRLRRAAGISHQSCVCVTHSAVSPVASGAAALQTTSSLSVIAGDRESCRGYSGTVAGVSAEWLLDAGHLLTAGAASFARGVNDTPKIAALLLVAAAGGGGGVPLALVGIGIAAGGLLASRRVAGTMSHGITSMNDGQAFTANAVTALLVLFASRWGVPVSTTHVSVGSLFGLGALNGSARGRTILAILASWVVILPLAALLAAVAWLVASA